MNSLLNGSWNTDTFQLRNVVALLILDSVTLLPSILSSLTILSVLNSALPSRSSLLHSSLVDLTLPFLNISTNGIRDIMTLPLGHRLISGLGNLITNLLRDLTANWFRNSS